MKLDLVKLFPAGADGTHKMLPKQELFFKQVLNPKGPKYLAFISGVGGGKTITGCITMLAQAVMYPSTYLIARQYYPELKATTYRTFKDVCPPELIIEDRIADMEMRIKAINGKTSTILFRPLEAWDKLRSLNLGGFFIDEASQCSEEAFMLLQGRLRDPGGLRKGYCISNPNGHDWLYQWFYKQDFFKNEEVKKDYTLIRGTSLENTFLPKDYIDTMMNTWSEDRIRREVMGEFDVFEGAVYSEFRRDVHVIDEFEIPKQWTRVIGADHGFSNPSAAIFGAVSGDGDLYIYDEFYEKECLIQDVVTKGWLPRIGKDKIDAIFIDPSVKATRGQTGVSDFSTYIEHLPNHLALIPANNEVSAGIDRVKSFLKVNEKSGRPKMFIFKRCKNLIEELVQYRWDTLLPSQAGRANAKESPRKYNDHACFVAGTMVRTPSGEVPIEAIKPGDLVMTTLGPRPVIASGKTGIRSVFDYGVFTSTPDHPVLLSDGSKVAIADLTDYSKIVKFNVCKSSLMASYLGKLVDITEQTVQIATAVWNLCTGKFGKPHMDQYQVGTTSTMWTATPTTTTFQISPVLMGLSIYLSTEKQDPRFAEPPRVKNTWRPYGYWLPSGIKATPGVNGIGNTLSAWLRKWQSSLASGKLAKFAQKITRSLEVDKIKVDSVTKTVGLPLFVGVEPVYNLSVHGVSEFYANGVLVSNCDALRYLVMSRPDPAKVDKTPSYKKGWPTAEKVLQAELAAKRNPPQKDPFGDY